MSPSLHWRVSHARIDGPHIVTIHEHYTLLCEAVQAWRAYRRLPECEALLRPVLVEPAQKYVLALGTLTTLRPLPGETYA